MRLDARARKAVKATEVLVYGGAEFQSVPGPKNAW